MASVLRDVPALGRRGFHLAVLGEPSSWVPLGLPVSRHAEPVGEPCPTLGGMPAGKRPAVRLQGGPWARGAWGTPDEACRVPRRGP